MKITVISVGKLKEKFWISACQEYIKRIGAYSKIQVIEIPDINPSSVGGDKEAVQREGAAIIKKLQKLPQDTYKIALCIEEKELSSPALAKKIQTEILNGKNHIVFIIGGSCGLSSDVITNTDFQLSFGQITLPHNLARVVLLEQVYRSFRIIHGETYHK